MRRRSTPARPRSMRSRHRLRQLRRCPSASSVPASRPEAGGNRPGRPQRLRAPGRLRCTRTRAAGLAGGPSVGSSSPPPCWPRRRPCRPRARSRTGLRAPAGSPGRSSRSCDRATRTFRRPRTPTRGRPPSSGRRTHREAGAAQTTTAWPDLPGTLPPPGPSPPSADPEGAPDSVHSAGRVAPGPRGSSSSS